jgi:hypothetical protein
MDLDSYKGDRVKSGRIIGGGPGGKNAFVKAIGDAVVGPMVSATLDSYKDEIRQAVVGNVLSIVEDIVRQVVGQYLGVVSGLKGVSSPDAAVDALKISVTNQINAFIDKQIPPVPPQPHKPGEVVIDIQINPIVKTIVSKWVDKLFDKVKDILKNNGANEKLSKMKSIVDDKSQPLLSMKPKNIGESIVTPPK